MPRDPRVKLGRTLSTTDSDLDCTVTVRLGGPDEVEIEDVSCDHCGATLDRELWPTEEEIADEAREEASGYDGPDRHEEA